MMLSRKQLHRDQTGVAALEFALVAPLFLVMVMVMLNVGQMAYGLAVLNGAVQDAARGTTLEGANTAAADTAVQRAIGPVLPGAKVTGMRKSYYDFIDIGRPEAFTDKNADGTCNNSESYVDENSSGSWEAEVGASGNGGANDVVVYAVEARYSPLFTVPFAPDKWSSITLKASSVKKNQPYSTQAGYGKAAGVCK